MAFWGRVFGSDKALEGIVDGVKNGIDALVYTDEERAGAAASDRSEARAMVVQWMESTKGQNLARRLIALSITGTWLFMYLVSAVSGMIAPFTSDERLTVVGQVAADRAGDMNAAVMLILAFYFAAPHMSGIVEAILSKKTSSTVSDRKG